MQGTVGERLHARQGHGDGWTALRLDGVIDEHNGLDRMVTALDAAPMLLVDLGAITRINSVGVRDWVVWLRELRARFEQVVLFDCPPAIMNEVNLVQNFAEGALIATFQAPYYCERCGKEEIRRLDAAKMVRDGVQKAPSFPCDKAACANALDDVEESYFAFFDDQRRLQPPPDLDRLLAAARAALDTGETIALEEAPTSTGAANRRPLGSIGRSAQLARADTANRALQSSAAGLDAAPPPPPPPGEADLIFVVVLVAMLGVLGVLIYLITTLE